ncbi:hypothetical protein LCGC14_2473980, partial [marine sediment metagenome]
MMPRRAERKTQRVLLGCMRQML